MPSDASAPKAGDLARPKEFVRLCPLQPLPSGSILLCLGSRGGQGKLRLVILEDGVHGDAGSFLSRVGKPKRGTSYNIGFFYEKFELEVVEPASSFLAQEKICSNSCADPI